MTKNVRIENADTNDTVGLKVEVYMMQEGVWVLDYVKNLPTPTQLTEIVLHSDRQVRISEYKFAS